MIMIYNFHMHFNKIFMKHVTKTTLQHSIPIATLLGSCDVVGRLQHTGAAASREELVRWTRSVLHSLCPTQSLSM